MHGSVVESLFSIYQIPNPSIGCYSTDRQKNFSLTATVRKVLDNKMFYKKRKTWKTQHLKKNSTGQLSQVKVLYSREQNISDLH